jgi:hypothetical protein
MERPVRKYVSPVFGDFLKALSSDLRDIGIDVPEHTLSRAIANSFRKGPVPIIVVKPLNARGRPPRLNGGFYL